MIKASLIIFMLLLAANFLWAGNRQGDPQSDTVTIVKDERISKGKEPARGGARSNRIAVPTKKIFTPKEKISADIAVSFPADI